MKHTRNLILFVCIGVLVGGLVYYFANKSEVSREDRIAKRRQDCKTEKVMIETKKDSASIKKGTKITVEKNYYRCFKGMHGDVVVLGTLDNPRFSKIQIAPDDTVKVTKVDKQFLFSLSINDVAITNRANKKGYFNLRQIGLLKTFVDKNNGIIPDDVYFVWEENIEEGIRTVYGSAILGKAIL